MGRRITEEEHENKLYRLEIGRDGLQAYVAARLRKVPDLVSFKVMKANINGVSDIICCCKGTFVAIELKVGNNKPSLNQSRFLEKTEKAGGICGVAYTWGEVKDILRKAGCDDFPEK